jgi:hypothetical protein
VLHIDICIILHRIYRHKVALAFDSVVEMRRAIHPRNRDENHYIFHLPYTSTHFEPIKFYEHC